MSNLDKCVARQSIKNVISDEIEGYELCFEDNIETVYLDEDDMAAGTISAFIMNNSEDLLGDKKLFITFTPTLLFKDTPTILQRDKVVIQIACNLLIHPLTVKFVERYQKEGYSFAINDFRFSPKYFEILKYVDYVRMNAGPGLDKAERKTICNVIDMVHSFGKKFIATDITDEKSYIFAISNGADYVEGSYIAETLVKKVPKGEFLNSNFFQLVAAVSEDEPDMAEIEEIVIRDTGLSFALLKLVNSAYFALRHRTASIRQALVTLGVDQLRQWVYMLSFRGKTADSNDEILKLSFLRANFAQKIVEMTNKTGLTSGEGYMLGMFSMLEYLVNGKIEELLKGIPIKQEMWDALVNYEGNAGMILKFIIAYERTEWKLCEVYADELGLKLDEISSVYMSCLKNVNSIWSMITEEIENN